MIGVPRRFDDPTLFTAAGHPIFGPLVALTLRFSMAERLSLLIRPTTPGTFPVTVQCFHTVSGRPLYTARTFITVTP